MDPHLRPFVEKLWHYHHLGQELRRSDAILVLCSHDLVVAERAAQLWLDGWAPLLIFSGGLGSVTRRLWQEPEADQFAKIATAMGVQAEAIVIENRSTNTGENVRFTRERLAELDLDPATFIVVQKPYMERRSYAAFRKVWPEKELVVTSPQFSLDEYLDRTAGGVAPGSLALTGDEMIAIMVGDLQRIRIYPEKGFQIPQEIPADVWEAYEALVAAGYVQHLVPADIQ